MALFTRTNLSFSFLRPFPPHLLVLGDGVEQPGVQLGVVLGEGLVPIVVDQLHHRVEGQGLRKAVFAIPVEDLDQLVIPTFPVRGEKQGLMNNFLLSLS